jgi:hypothetical protein
MPRDPPVQERAYQAIRAGLLNGRFRLRERLDASAIAAELGVSATPVREALTRLTVERLVAFQPARGFFVAFWTEAGLRELYQWRGDLARLALNSAMAAPLVIAPNHQAESYPERVRAVLNALHSGATGELVRAAANADDRLTRARNAERDLWTDAERDLEALAAALAQNPAKSGQAALRRYFARRAGAAKQIRDRAALLALPPNGG